MEETKNLKKNLQEVQEGVSFIADFEENTWTFQMHENFTVSAGDFIIIKKESFNEILDILKH
jgi:hypothetical protein